MQLELTRHQRELLVICIGQSIEKERRAIQHLQTEIRAIGVTAAICERTRVLSELDRLRKKLIAPSTICL